MEMLPSRQALNELMLWMDAMEKAIEENEIETFSCAQDVDNMMQIYQVRTKKQQLQNLEHLFLYALLIDLKLI